MKKLSAIQKKEIFNLSSLFVHILIFICLLITLNHNSEEKKVAKKDNIYASSPEYKQYKAALGRIATTQK